MRAPPDDSHGDLETIVEEDTDDELYKELVPISAPTPLDPVAAVFLPPQVDTPVTAENPDAGSDGMEDPMQAHSDPIVTGTDHQADADGYPVVPNPDLPMITGSDERPTEVTQSESGPDVAEVEPVQDLPYVT